MNESDLDNAIAQAEIFLTLAKDLKTGFQAQNKAVKEAEVEAIKQKLSEEETRGRIITARYYNKMEGTRLIGSVKHACVTLSFLLAKLRK